MSGLGLPVLIRAYGRGDLKEAASVMFRSASEAYRDINWNPDEDRVLQSFDDRAGDPWETMFVAVSEGRVVGVMCLIDTHVDQLFVDVGWQGRGIGRDLLHEAKRKCPGGFTLDVFSKNKPALAFYLNYGLTILREEPSPLAGEDQICLQWLP